MALNLSNIDENRFILKGTGTIRAKDTLKANGGSWNRNLQGWTYPNTKRDAIMSLLAQMQASGYQITVDNSPAPQTQQPQPQYQMGQMGQMGQAQQQAGWHPTQQIQGSWNQPVQPTFPQQGQQQPVQGMQIQPAQNVFAPPIGPVGPLIQPVQPPQTPSQLMQAPLQLPGAGPTFMARPVAPLSNVTVDKPNSFTVPFRAVDGMAYQLVTMTVPLPLVDGRILVGEERTPFLVQTVGNGLPVRTARAIQETNPENGIDIVLLGEHYYLANPQDGWPLSMFPVIFVPN
jgi:hypothetical protein